MGKTFAIIHITYKKNGIFEIACCDHVCKVHIVCEHFLNVTIKICKETLIPAHCFSNIQWNINMILYLLYIEICKDLIYSIYSSINFKSKEDTYESLTSICLTSIHYTICVFIPPYLFPFYTSHSCSKPCNLSKRLRATCHGLYFHNLYVVKHFIHVFVRANGNKRKIMRLFFAPLLPSGLFSTYS